MKGHTWHGRCSEVEGRTPPPILPLPASVPPHPPTMTTTHLYSNGMQRWYAQRTATATSARLQHDDEL